MKRGIYLVTGFVLGCSLTCIFSARLLEAQSAFDKGNKGFSYDRMTPSVPAHFGDLVAVNGIEMYFQGEGGAIYKVKPRSGGDLDTRVVMIPRS